MVAKKWIIYDGKLLISASVEFHMELLPKDYDVKKIGGGGRWEILDKRLYEGNTMLFYGTSHDFFSATPEGFKSAYEATLLSEAVSVNTPFFSTKEWFSDALKEFNESKTTT